MSLSVIVVEDEPLVRKAVVKALKRSGLRLTDVFEADNGEMGLQILSQNNIDFALVDLHLSGMEGDEMIRRAKFNLGLRRLPFVFISGEQNQNRIEQMKNQGLGWIKKPFNPETLAEIIMNMISVP